MQSVAARQVWRLEFIHTANFRFGGEISDYGIDSGRKQRGRGAVAEFIATGDVGPGSTVGGTDKSLSNTDFRTDLPLVSSESHLSG